MASLTPAEITKIAEPLELIYQNMTDELMINIARHLKGGWDATARWEIKKLGQLGKLTEESAKIIAKYSGQSDQQIKEAFLQAAQLATADIDPELARAAATGVLTDPQTTVATSRAMQSALQSYVDQATDTLNMTNTTMLESTRQVYVKAVNTASNTVQLEQAKTILETQAGEVITGQQTRTRAMRAAVDQVMATGITGFYDRLGRQWSPEAYVNMVIKTTSHNAAIQAIRTRQQEYGGGDVFQISSHSGARPLCYPYQGKLYSWSGDGVFIDGEGNEHPYEDISRTSYGEPAGIFGINCGHHPIPMINGFSFMQEYEEQTPEENAKEYEESQKQRSIERDIRDAKRQEEMCRAAGDEEGARAAHEKVKHEQARMRQFIDETGRPRRYDREQIGGRTPATIPQTSVPKPAPAPVSNVPDVFKNVTGLPNDNKKAMAEALANSPNETARQLYTKYADELNVVDANRKKGAADFVNWRGGIRFNAADDLLGGNLDNPCEVSFHEFGHMIDWLGNKKNRLEYTSQMGYGGETLLEVIQSDYKAFRKKMGASTNAELINMLSTEKMPIKTCGNISDILEKCTYTSYPLGVGHGRSYHTKEGKTEREFFTEVISSSVVNPPSYDQMVRLFPNAVNMVWKMVEGLLK